MGLQNMIITAILIGMFAFALISFSVTIGNENNSSISITDDDSINRTFHNIESEIGNVRGDAETQREGFFTDIPLLGTVEVVLVSIFGITRTFIDTTRNFFDLILTLIATNLGISPVILSGIIAILIISSILYAWRVYRAGS